MEKNKISCDVNTGVCNVMSSDGTDQETTGTVLLPESTKPIQMIYVTDPLCCYCWQAEPVLRKFIELYGQYMDTHIIMGGLL